MNPLKRFKEECKGSAAIMFAVAVLPILVASGMAIDYSRAVSRRSALQNALDGAVLASSKLTGNQTDEQIKTFILSYVANSQFGSIPANKLTLTRDPANRTLTATADASVPTTLMSLAGINELNISVTTRASWGRAEVVLVLDNSGTMSSSNRLTALQTAAKSFVDQAGGTATGSIGAVNIGLVPYAVSTRVPHNGSYNGVAYKDAPWILFTGGSFNEYGEICTFSEDGEDGEDGQSCTKYLTVSKSSWNGCMNDRLWDLDTNDVYYNGENSAKYPARETCRSTESNLQTVFPLALPTDTLSTHLSSLKSHIDGMVAGGGANMTIGVAWGHAMLSSHVPFIGGTNSDTRRIIILVAAGANSGAHVWSNQAEADERTQMACTSAKNAGIEIFTVSMSFDNTNDTLLRNCASAPGNFFDANSAADLNGIFQRLALAIRTAKLTH